MKGVLEYFDKTLGCMIQKDIEAKTLQKARNACQKELEGRQYTTPALYIEEEEGENDEKKTYADATNS